MAVMFVKLKELRRVAVQITRRLISDPTKTLSLLLPNAIFRLPSPFLFLLPKRQFFLQDGDWTLDKK